VKVDFSSITPEDIKRGTRELHIKSKYPHLYKLLINNSIYTMSKLVNTFNPR